MKSKNQIIYERAWEWVNDNKIEDIKVTGDKCTMNQKCQNIAFHNAYKASQHRRTETRLVVALNFIPKSGVRIHFLNCFVTDDLREYYDEVLGYLVKYSKFFKLAEFTWDELADYDYPRGASTLLMEFKTNMLNALFTKEEQEELKLEPEDL